MTKAAGNNEQSADQQDANRSVSRNTHLKLFAKNIYILRLAVR